MPRTLYARLATALVLLLVAVGVLYAFISTAGTARYLEQVSQQFNRDLARNLVAERGLVVDGRIDPDAIADTFHQYMVINPSIEIYLLDTAGNILSYSADPGKVKRSRVALGPIRAFLDGRERFPVLGDDPRSPVRRKAFSATPVPSADDVQGYLYVVLRGEAVEAVERALGERFVARASAWAVAASLGLGLVGGLVAFRLITRRVQRLATEMDEFTAGNYTAPVVLDPSTPDPGDEVDRLRRTFAQMATRIAGQLEQLQRTDHWRRELVAQVSHDLRTPLAALHGYLETLDIKDADLDPDTRREYLAVALRHSARLSRLVAELFELAALDARDDQPRCEAFPITDLAQDVTQKLALHASERGVAIEIAEATRLPLVYADIGLIERVFENLIENALAHTPRDGEVRVAFAAGEQHIAIAVSDTGPGIDPADRERVFEPFFRGRERAGDRGGLGLAIARRIVELHGGRISAHAATGGGAELRFTLPRAG